MALVCASSTRPNFIFATTLLHRSRPQCRCFQLEDYHDPHFLALLSELREKENLSILFITHDLGVVAETCDRVAVAYAGRIVEIGAIDDVLYETKHPYTKGLLGAMPDLIPHGHPLQVITGSVPDGLNPVAGCPFHPRCPDVMDICRAQESPFINVGQDDHLAACHLYEKEGVS
ncbi:MAG: ABC transporter ATP-binding protein [Chloroflexi bacterium]|nr:MAG: ABC transporter ATP-binding protein [Chloroflexota bacterium]